MIRLVVAVVVTLVGFAALSAAAAPPPRGSSTGASAVILRITVPGQDTVSLGQLEWPDSTSADVQSFVYPADGSVVNIGRSRDALFAATGSAATSESYGELIVVSLFNGEIVAGKVTASATAGASARSAGASTSLSSVQGLRALGRDIPSTPGTTDRARGLGDAERALGSTGSRKSGPPAAQASVTALRITLTAAHGGLPAGSEIVIGTASATAVADLSAPARPRPSGGVQRPHPVTSPKPLPHAPEPDVGGEVPGGPGPGRPRGHRTPLVGRASSSRSTGRRRSGTASARRGRTSPGAGITARTSSPRRERRCSRSRTGRSTRSGSTASAATGSGCATRRVTSSTTRTSLRTRRSRWRGDPSRPET